MSQFSGSSFASGAAGAGLAEAVQGELAKINDPQIRLLASALVGAAAAKIVGGNAQAGAITAFYGTKYNDYGHKPTYNGAIIYVVGQGFYQVSIDANGNEVDLPMQTPPPIGVYYWYENPYDQSNGWDSVRGNGSVEEDLYYPGKVNYQFVAGSVFGYGVGYQLTNYTDAQKQQQINSLVQQYANGMLFMAPFVGTGGSASLANGAVAADQAAMYYQIALQATQGNINSDIVVLGKFNASNLPNYIDVANDLQATYFSLDNWNAVQALIGEENMWNINAAFLQQQLNSGKSFVLAADPATATGFFAQEVTFLKNNGYHFESYVAYWRAVK
jgi:hypothetical protein